MDSQFIVEIVSASARPRQDVIQDLAKAFNVKPDKAEALLARLDDGPATVGKPSEEAAAQRMAQAFRNIGLEVRVRPWLARPEMPVQTPALVHPASAIPAMLEQQQEIRALANVSTSSTPTYSSGESSYDDGQQYGAPQNHTPRGPAFAGPRQVANATSNPMMDADEQMPASLQEVEDATAGTQTESDLEPVQAQRRVSLSSKFLFASILPTVLAVGMAVGAILLTVPNALRTLQLEGARNPAIALAGGVEGLLTGAALDAKAATKLQTSLSTSQATLRLQNVEGVFVTDALGNPVAGWYGTGTGVASLPESVRAYVQLQARRATAQQYMMTHDFPKGTYNPPSRLTDAAGTPLEVAAYPIQRDGNAIGTSVVMMNSQAVSSRVQSTVLVTLLASALPIILAVLIAAFLARNITRNVIRLVKAADHISMGNLENPVDVRTNDELNELGEALERMRVSLHESLERLRKRRK
jgi:HAMP domain-containing protein